MAYTPRSINTIKAQIIGQIPNYPALSALSLNISQVAKYGLWAFISAVAINLLEQLLAIFQSDLEETISAAPVGSEPWLQSKIFEFQYSVTNPQALELVNFAPAYNPIDTTLRIITRGSVKTSPFNQVKVKVAKQEPPVALSAPELSALQSYLTSGGNVTYAGRGRGLGFAGVDIIATSNDADLLFIAGTVFYNGQYSAVIKANVITAINAYLASLPFDGSFSLLGITDAIQTVTGVNDILLTDVAYRANGVAFGLKTYMIQANTTIITTTDTFAGYIIGETTLGETFADRINFVASS